MTDSSTLSTQQCYKYVIEAGVLKCWLTKNNFNKSRSIPEGRVHVSLDGKLLT